MYNIIYLAHIDTRKTLITKIIILSVIIYRKYYNLVKQWVIYWGLSLLYNPGKVFIFIS